MKPKRFAHHFISALFAFALAISSIGNLITGYELPVDAMQMLYLWCAFAAIAGAVLFRFPRVGKITAGVAAVAVFRLCLKESFQLSIRAQIETLCYCISSHCHAVYNWPILGAQSASDVSFPLILWAVIVAFSVNWYICRRKHIAVAIVPAVLPLLLCLLTADRVPDAAYLYLLILGLATLLISDWTRRTQPDQSTKLVLRFVLPIALFLGLIFLCNPEASYVNHAGKIQKELSSWLEDSSTDKNLDLQAVGASSKSSRVIMLVNAPVNQTLYLRERDYDIYTGVAWDASPGRKEKFTPGTISVGTLTILTYSTRDTLLIPYYATGEIELVDGALENKNSLQQYSYTLAQTLSPRTSIPSQQYTELPAKTQAWAKKLVKKITTGAKTKKEKILKIQKYVRSSAVYDTTTGQMDPSYSDFAQWFLEESKSGDCVHYATAATVLLRACNIPARYVEGYIVNCKAGTDVPISRQDAHAWVEYYDWTSRAWCVLEATPAFSQTGRPVAVPNAPQGGGAASDDSADIPENDTPTKKPSVETKPTEEPSATPTTGPEETKAPDGSISQNQELPPGKVSIWIPIASGCILLVFCALLQGWVRIYRKRKLWNRGAPNVRTIWRWRQTRSLAKRLKQLYPEELDALAQKARFSQHEIQPDELQMYEDYRLTLVALIAEKPWYQRMVFKWIFAIA